MKKFYIHNRQTADAEISENGVDWQTVSTEELENRLKRLQATKDSCIIYSREQPSADPSSHAERIFRMVEAARLPIRLVKKKGSDGSGESEPNNEGSYANCLLVTLAKSPRTVAVLESGQAVPDLETLSTNPHDLPWIRGLPFDYRYINADIVINLLISAAKKTLVDSILTISARFALPEGKSEMVQFQVKRVKPIGKGQRIEVTRI